MPQLNKKQERFCDEYLIDLNGAQAAIRAGYSKKTARTIASRLLTNVNVEAYIQKRRCELKKSLEISQENVLRETARIAFSDLRNIMSWKGENVYLKDSSELSEDDAAIISEVTKTIIKDGCSIKIKTYDKLNALEKLCKNLDLFKADSTGKSTIQMYVADQQDTKLLKKAPKADDTSQ